MSSQQSNILIKPLCIKHKKQNKKQTKTNKVNKITKQSKTNDIIKMKRDHASETAKSVSKYYSLRKKRSENYYDRIDENAKIFHGQTLYFEIPNDRRFAARTYETIDIFSAIEKLKSQKRIIRIIDHPDGHVTRLLRQRKWEYPLDKNLKPGIHLYDFRNGQNEPYYTYIPSQNKDDYNDEEDDILHRNERDDKRNKVSSSSSTTNNNNNGNGNDESDDENDDESDNNSDESDNDNISENNNISENDDDSDNGLDILKKRK